MNKVPAVSASNVCLQFGDVHAVKNVCFELEEGRFLTVLGPSGSGKTTFVKGVLKGLNYKHDVTSPTYTLINEYHTKYKIIHIDCYREKDINRWLNIGIFTIQTSDIARLSVIIW